MNDMRTGVGGLSASWRPEISNGDIGETEVFQSDKSAIAQVLRDLQRIKKKLSQGSPIAAVRSATAATLARRSGE